MHVHFGEINGAFRFVYFTSYMSYFNKKFTETATLRSAYLSVCQQFQSWAMSSVGEAVKKGSPGIAGGDATCHDLTE